jgi:hypothetical protein
LTYTSKENGSFFCIRCLYTNGIRANIEDLDCPTVSAIAEAKQRSKWSVIGWVTKLYCLQLLRASERTLSRWSRLHLQSLVPAPVQGGLTSGRRPVVKIIAESLSQHDKNMLYRPHLDKGRKKKEVSQHKHM